MDIFKRFYRGGSLFFTLSRAPDRLILPSRQGRGRLFHREVAFRSSAPINTLGGSYRAETATEAGRTTVAKYFPRLRRLGSIS